MVAVEPKFVEVYRGQNIPEAHTIRIALEDAGITAWVEGEFLQGALGDLPAGWMTTPRVMVEQSHAEEAKRVIAAEHFHSVEGTRTADDRPSSDEPLVEVDRCLACGEVMQDVETCPACGWSYRDDGATTPSKNG
ncbi:MAG: DUF2007 domain-containing protein [Planctomycetaceae bacterium]